MGLVATGSTQAYLTSNSQFLFVGTTLYLVTNSNASGTSQILSSTNYGVSFTTLQTISGLSAGFDPAIAVDVNGVIHIVGTIYSGGLSSLKLWRYTPSSNTLVGPFVVTSGSNIGGDYDIAPDAQGYPGENIVAFTVNPTGTITGTDTLMNSPFQSGNTFGQVCFLTQDGANFELYVGSHPKSITFKDFPLNIQLMTYSGGVWSATSSLYVGSGRYVSDKMNVIASGEYRYFSHCIYSQNRYGLSGNILLGYSSTGPTGFIWQYITGSPTSSYSEPTLSVAPEGASLAYIVRDYTSPTETAGSVVVNSLGLPSFALVAEENFRYQTTATYLRGTDGVLPPDVLYAIAAEAMPGGTTTFYCGYDSPPVPVVSPTAETIQRDTPYTLSGIETTDATLDNLVFTWTSSNPDLVLEPNGYECVVTLPLSVGPDALTITVTMSVVAVNNAGVPLHPAVTATCTLTVLEIDPPVISPQTTTPTAARNSSFTLTPTVTYTGGYPLTYSWAQTAGTTLTAQNLDIEDLTFYTNGANINGETITWVLTVSDGINEPVSQAFNVAVAAYGLPLTSTYYYNRSQRPATISQRNDAVDWPVLTSSILSTEYTNKHLAMNTSGNIREVLINPYSVLVYAPQENATGQHVAHWRLLPPDTDTFLDAAQTESDFTLVLTAGGYLYQYIPIATALTNDNPQYSLNLASYSGFTFTNVVCGYSYANVRVVVLYGPDGCLLLQYTNNPFVLISALELSVKTGFIYGSSDILWVRIYNAENLNTGQVFLGTVDSSGNTYETLIDLSSRQVVGTWDAASNLANTTVSTGEFLFQTPDTYGGVPIPPVITNIVFVQQQAQLTWTQNNSSLASGYIVYMSTDGVNFTPKVTILSGAVQYASISGLTLGTTYSFYVITTSLDGSSGPSATVTLTPTSSV
jgi:hypothetical protein